MSGSWKVRSKSSLAIVERAYRGSLEEQYGHIVWLSRVMKAMDTDHALLLKGDAVLYARKDQPRIALTIGDLTVSDLSHYESCIQQLLAQGVNIHIWQPDMQRLGLSPALLVEGVKPLEALGMPTLIHRYDCVWYW
jgi:predicted peroxiredoxin